MSLEDDLTAVRRRLDDLARTVDRLEERFRQQAAAPSSAAVGDLVHIPDTPYDHTLWTDSDDEGLGRDRRAS